MNPPFGIEINFLPFKIIFFEDNENPDDNLNNLPDLDFFSLPDILYEDNSRKFLGLSFSVNFGKEYMAKKLCTNSIHVNFINEINEVNNNRYIGFKKSSRLEILLEKSNFIECEPASLSDGYWLGIESSTPSTYRILNIPDLITDHSMKW